MFRSFLQIIKLGFYALNQRVPKFPTLGFSGWHETTPRDLSVLEEINDNPRSHEMHQLIAYSVLASLTVASPVTLRHAGSGAGLRQYENAAVRLADASPEWDNGYYGGNGAAPMTSTSRESPYTSDGSNGYFGGNGAAPKASTSRQSTFTSDGSNGYFGGNGAAKLNQGQADSTMLPQGKQ